MASGSEAAQQQQKRASVFKRGAKAELFEDGQEHDEQEELQSKLGDLHSAWAMERSGRDLAAAIWRPKLGLAEVVLQKGKLLSHMGFTRGGKLYLFIEETVYLLDRANLLLFLDQAQQQGGGRRHQQQPSQRLLSLAEAHDLMLTTGVALDRYLVFCKLLRAGYIVQRHPARWLLRPGEDPGQAWAGWGQAPAAPLEAAGGQQQQQQPKQQKVMQQTTAMPASLPAARPAKRRSLLVQHQLEPPRRWWALEAEAAGTQMQQAAADGNQRSDASSGACASSIGTNPWLRGMPAGFLDTLPKVEVVPDAAQRARLDFPRMAPLQAVALPDLQLQTGPAGGRHLLHYDVFSSNSRFSRKAPGAPAFTVSVAPCTRLPTLRDMAAADAAAGGAPVRFCTIEKGDICFYGLSHVELRSIMQS
ncbi:hypothetical protein D9Q98_008477 [Chlorella vulgaris]|uniref:tRNA-splicing endonuclease subunit Sen54 N-terminal domain-containing protein n=1 Tax=Chlorella vulgaris TaxID=3077 RepID=A0A9D4TGQ2_CHLVU|nr:hypothetical protein D9Q98_008477 [Chlorella vulgaris]